MEKRGRNELCHCGSGKKYKNCHMNTDTTARGKNKAFIIVMLLVGFAAIGSVTYYMNSQNTANQAIQPGGFKPGPPPAGDPPPGKVWSYEHGHWHDAV